MKITDVSELEKIALEDVKDDMQEIVEHFNNLNYQLLEKMYKEKAEVIKEKLEAAGATVEVK